MGYIIDLTDEELHRLDAWLATDDGEKNAIILFKAYLKDLSVRSFHIVQIILDGGEPTSSFIRRLIRIEARQLARLPNCGRKSIKEIMNSVCRFRTDLYRVLPDSFELLSKGQGDEEEDDSETFSLQTLTQDALVLTEGLSTRSINAIKALLFESDNDIIKLYKQISAKDFNWRSMPNIGRKSYPEVKKWGEEFKKLVGEHSDVLGTGNDSRTPSLDVAKGDVSEAESAPVMKQLLQNHVLSPLIPDETDRNSIFDMEQSIGYFPVFYALQSFLEHALDERERTVLEDGIRFRAGQTIKTAKMIAHELKMTGESITRLRKAIIKKLESYFRTINKLLQEEQCPYNCEGKNIEREINLKECTSFSRDFIHWTIGSVFRDYKFVGDTYHTLTTPFSNVGFIALVPLELTKAFNFKSFISKLDELVVEKRKDDKRVLLQSIIDQNYKSKSKRKEELSPAVKKACLSIINTHFGLEIYRGSIVFKANTIKALPDVIYDVIRSNGAPMTSEQLADEIELLYPGREFKRESIGNCALRHPKVLAIGRTHTYTLKAWKSGTERGGTIRSFVCEYLNSQKEPIATETNVCEYVRRFRPSSSDKSIISNLLQEENRKFSIYEKEGIRYVGYTKKTYPQGFRVLAGHRPLKRTSEESMNRLVQFIQINKRYPRRNNSDEEETRLCRFVENRRYACFKNTIPEGEINKWRVFEEKYCKFDHARKNL